MKTKPIEARMAVAAPQSAGDSLLYTLREMPLKCPAAWKAFGNREWYKERRRAVQIFHGLLPFLPGGEEPASLATKGSRSK